MGQASGELYTYLCLDCAKNLDINWNITVSFIIHVNFDHAWVEHYTVTLTKNGLFHLMSIHPLWMTANECPGGYFEACPGG